MARQKVDLETLAMERDQSFRPESILYLALMLVPVGSVSILSKWPSDGLASFIQTGIVCLCALTAERVLRWVVSGAWKRGPSVRQGWLCTDASMASRKTTPQSLRQTSRLARLDMEKLLRIEDLEKVQAFLQEVELELESLKKEAPKKP